MQIQFNQWQSINLQNFVDSFQKITDSVKDTDNTLTGLSFSHINIYDGNNNSAYGNWGGINISLTGRDFLGSNPVATNVKLTDNLFGNNEKYTLTGNIKASSSGFYTYYVNGGTFTSLTHSDDGVRDYSIKGSFSYSAGSINRSIIKSAEINFFNSKLIITGAISLDANEAITGGSITSISYTAADGKSFTISNVLIDVADLRSVLLGAGSSTDFSTLSSFLFNNANLSGSDSITGDLEDNILDGGAGVDKLIGGLGNDTYIVDLVRTGTKSSNYKVVLQDSIIEAANAGTDTVQLRSLSGIDYSAIDNPTTLTLGANLENLDASATDTTKLNLTGNALGNTLTGNDANNILDGGKGIDTLIGGLGNDTYILDLKVSAGNIDFEDSITENSNEGIDTIKLRGNATLATTATLTLDSSRGWENIEIIDASATGKTKLDLTGNDHGNTLIGNAAVNALTGGTGHDTLNGGAGADIMIGSDGNDIYIVDNKDDQVIELNGEGTDEIRTSITYSLALLEHVEHLTLTGAAAINGSGNDLDNVIIGNTGNNTLDGGLGADTMAGGKGNDTYIVDDEDDVVVELDGQGTDLVKASIEYELTDFVENLTLTGTDHINGTGNALKNTITGNSGNNILDGGAGVDKLAGGLGNDTYIVDLVQTGSSAANYKLKLEDTITEAKDAGTDTVQLRGIFTDPNKATALILGSNLENLNASATGPTKLNLTGNTLNNTLTGNDADNILDGGKGDDTLIGGLGNDTLKGGLGADAFKWSLEDAGSAGDISRSTDTITDFSISQGDQLDLRDLLDGESNANILDYISIETVGTSTLLHISTTGQFNGSYNAGQEDARITLLNTNLLTATGQSSFELAIQHMITNQSLLVD